MEIDGLSLKEVFLYNNNPLNPPYYLRQKAGFSKGHIRFQVKPYKFTFLTYNTALMIDAWYNGRNRTAALNEFIKHIKNIQPDVVGLCEVFKDGERDEIRSKLSSIYIDYREGPDEDDIDQDGGLLILSKYPILESHSSIYRDAAFPDSWSNKGIIHIEVKPQNSEIACDVFFTHAQDKSVKGGQEALYGQLTHLGRMVQAYSNPYRPAFIMGDLNIPAQNPANYGEMLKRLNMPVDLWKTKYPRNPGFTCTVDNDFPEDPDNASDSNKRLDYIFIKPGKKYFPVLKEIEILRWRNSYSISDHYGLYVRFEQLLKAQVEISGEISKVSVTISSFFCVETTRGLGKDEVVFVVTVYNDSQSTTGKSKTRRFEDIDNYDSRKITRMRPAVLNIDPGSYIDIKVLGLEYDDLSRPERIGEQSIRISRIDLLLNKEAPFYRSIPFLNSNGEYSIELKISVS